MKRGILILLTSFLLHWVASAQQSSTHEIDSLYAMLKTAKEDTNKVGGLTHLAWLVINIGNYHEADSLADTAFKLSTTLNFKKGIANSYNTIGLIYWRKSDYSNALKNYFAALQIDKTIDNKLGLGTVYGNMGIIYDEQGNYPEALKNYFESLKIAQEMGDDQKVSIAYGNIGAVHNELGNYKEALKNQVLGLNLATKASNKHVMAIAYVNIGNIYNLLRNYDEALKNELQGLSIAQETNNRQCLSLAYTNVGDIYTKTGKYSEALKYHMQSLKIGKEIGNKQCIGLAYVNMGDVLRKEKKYTEAKKYLDSALRISKDIGNKEVTEDVYDARVLLDSATGDYKAAYTDHKLFILYRDSLKNEESTRKIVSDQMGFEFDKKMATEKAEQEKREIIKDAENKRKNIITYGIITVGILIAILIISILQIKRKQERKILRLEKQYAEEELINAKRALENYTSGMVEKTELLEQFKTDIEKLQQELDKTKIEQLEHLNKATILTEQDWDKFKGLFEQVHHGYISRLTIKVPDLTQAEMRLVCLTKLRLGTKHMANILGVSANTIRQSRWRLRKKMGLEEGDSIDDIAESI